MGSYVNRVQYCLFGSEPGLANDDKLSVDFFGVKVREVWRMPLKIDKLINSKNADVQNINYVGGRIQQYQFYKDLL